MSISEIISKLNERELSELRLDYSREGKFVRVYLVQQFKANGKQCFVVEDEHFKESYERRVGFLESYTSLSRSKLEKELASYLRSKVGERRAKYALIRKYKLVITNPEEGYEYYKTLEVGTQATVDVLSLQYRENKNKLPLENTQLLSYVNNPCIGIETVVVTLSNLEGDRANLFRRNAEKSDNFTRVIKNIGEIKLTHQEYLEIKEKINQTNHSTIR